MKCDKKFMQLYAVTDRSWTGEKTLIQQVEEALKGGITCLQLREKELAADEFFKEAVEIRALCSKHNVPFIINDNVEIAIKCGADGIHTGQTDMDCCKVRKLVGDKMIVGISAQTVQEAVEAEKNGADYIGVGAIFSTSTKLDADSVSIDTLKKICESVSIPVVAIGGISEKNILELKGSKVDGVALVSAIFASQDIENTCKKLKKMSEEITVYD